LQNPANKMKYAHKAVAGLQTANPYNCIVFALLYQENCFLWEGFS
jgi:hypothetical protein